MPENTVTTDYPVSQGLTTSDEIGELAKALASARKDFKPVLKDANNPFFKSKYADLAGVIEATSDALSKNGLVVIQSPRLTLNRIAVTTLLAHSSGQWLRDELELPLSKFDAQGAGSAITYARRYSYQAIVGVAAEDDDGNAASQKFEKQADGNFARTENVQKPVETKKPVKKKESVPDAGKPWGGLAGNNAPNLPENTTVGNSVLKTDQSVSNGQNIHGLDIKDEEIPFPGDPEPEVQKTDRLATDLERTGFQKRLVALRDKGYDGPALRAYLLKETGVAASQLIPLARFTELVDRLESAEKAGTLKELLGGK